jgi:hypothetical protein
MTHVYAEMYTVKLNKKHRKVYKKSRWLANPEWEEAVAYSTEYITIQQRELCDTAKIVLGIKFDLIVYI